MEHVMHLEVVKITQGAHGDSLSYIWVKKEFVA